MQTVAGYPQVDEGCARAASATEMGRSVPEQRSPMGRTVARLSWGCPVLLFAVGLAVLPMDMGLSDWLVRQRGAQQLDHFLGLIEIFGHATTLLIIGWAIFLCDVSRRWAWPRIITSALGAGLAADGIKLCVLRLRPRHFDFQGTVWQTFAGWFPGTSAGSGGQSCPSAHVATSVGMALALGTLYPRGRWLFLTLAALVAAQRVNIGAHYLSDTCWGAAVGAAFYLYLYRFPYIGLGRLFDKGEARLFPRWFCPSAEPHSSTSIVNSPAVLSPESHHRESQHRESQHREPFHRELRSCEARYGDTASQDSLPRDTRSADSQTREPLNRESPCEHTPFPSEIHVADPLAT